MKLRPSANIRVRGSATPSPTICGMALERTMRLLSERLMADLPALAERIYAVQSEDPSARRALDDAFSAEVKRRNIAASLHSIFTDLAEGHSPRAQAPATAIEMARVGARASVALTDLVRAYRLAQALTWDVILEQVETLDLKPDERLAVLRIVSRFLFEWNDFVTEELGGAYQQEHDRMYRDRERRTRELIRQLLEGLPVDSSSLRYNLRGDHVAIVGWGVGPDEAIRQLAVDLDASLLVTTEAGGSIVAWLGGEALRARDFPEGLRPRASPGTRLAVGRRCAGLDGFRLTHRQATMAHRVALLNSEPVVLYQDVALVALAGDDSQRLREFVANELGPLLTDDSRDLVLRDTLRAYFRTGQNAASAGPMLKVHERTVAYRLRTIETRLGCTIRERSEELAVALRVLDLLDESTIRRTRTP